MGKIDGKTLIIGLLVGLILGVLLGMLMFWEAFPVEWTDAHSYDLSPEAKAEHVALVADSYSLDKDVERAKRALQGWTEEELQNAFGDAKWQYEALGMMSQAQRVDDLSMVLGVSEPSPTPPEAPSGVLDRLRVPCLVFVIVLLVLVLGWIGYRILTQRRDEDKTTAAPAVMPGPDVPDYEGFEIADDSALGHFVTTYRLGEDTYDESFAVETSAGDFLGECGMGISEVAGAAEPGKVSAFEVWLFDKTDIRTVTKVLMSKASFEDDDLRSKLAAKGEAVLAQPNSPFTLETSGLEVHVNVSELEYDQTGPEPNSVFSKLTVELVTMTKATAGGADFV
jgi:hypothetical protein